MTRDPGYFDHNATTPLCPLAREAWLEATERYWHNPSSLYREAGAAKRRLEDTREELADLLGCEPERVVFTAGASEGNHAVFRHAARHAGPVGRVWISPLEHPSVRESARAEFGPERVIESLDFAPGGVALVSAMAANNEMGALLPWGSLAVDCRAQGVPFHCDAAQWIGKLPADGLAAACDWVTGCAHKFGGPKGTGFLVIPEAAVGTFRSVMGGPQELGHRAGTEDVPGILAMLAALREKNRLVTQERVAAWTADRARFENGLTERLRGARIVGAGEERLWNTAMVILPGAESNLKWLTRLSARGFSVSTGSACSSGKGSPSQVLAELGLNHEEMARVIRVSGGWETTAADWEALMGAFVEVSADLGISA